MLQYLSGEVLQNGGTVYCSCGSDTSMARRPVLEMSVDTAHGELGEMLVVKNKTIPVSTFASLILDGRHLQRHQSVLLTYLLNN